MINIPTSTRAILSDPICHNDRDTVMELVYSSEVNDGGERQL